MSAPSANRIIAENLIFGRVLSQEERIKRSSDWRFTEEGVEQIIQRDALNKKLQAQATEKKKPMMTIPLLDPPLLLPTNFLRKVEMQKKLPKEIEAERVVRPAKKTTFGQVLPKGSE